MLINQGKTKNIYYVDDDNIDCEFTDNITAFNGRYCDIIQDKGSYINDISAHLMVVLHNCGINNHFISKTGISKQRCISLKMIPAEIVIRNYAAGGFVKNHGFQYMDKLPCPIYEIYYKSDANNDPMVSIDVMEKIYKVSQEYIVDMIDTAFIANCALQAYMSAKGLRLVDIKFEFGIDSTGKVVLGDEISNESARIFDIDQQKAIDKDIYRDTRDIQAMKNAFLSFIKKLGISAN